MNASVRDNRFIGFHNILNNRNSAQRDEQFVFGICSLNYLKNISSSFSEHDKIITTVRDLSDLLKRHFGKNAGLISQTRDSEFAIISYDDEKTVFEKFRKIKQHYDRREIDFTFGYSSRNTERLDIDDVVKDANEFLYLSHLAEDKYNSAFPTLENLLTRFDKSTFRHTHNVENYAVALGEVLGFDPKEILKLKLSARMHDIGKALIDRDIITKPGKLTHEEYEKVKKHPIEGYHLLVSSDKTSKFDQNLKPELKVISDVALYGTLLHHRKYDGTGYPDIKTISELYPFIENDLIGKKLPLITRIITISDVFEAITEDRHYRPAMPIDEAKKLLIKGRGTDFDPEILAKFLEKEIYLL